MNFPTYLMPEFELLDETFRGKNLEKMAFGTVYISLKGLKIFKLVLSQVIRLKMRVKKTEVSIMF
jgi:hypothetical protein